MLASAVTTRPIVLLADDEQNNRLLLSSVLEELDCHVLSYPDGASVLAAAAGTNPAAVLLDVNMPGLDGLEVCRRLKADEKLRLTPVLMVTALGEVEDRVRALEAGADDFITKPFAAPEILARVRSFLRFTEVVRALDDAEHVVMALARAVEARDAYTDRHAVRVARTAARIARRAGLTGPAASALWLAASIHDIGKIGVPDRVLAKPGPLDADEMALMQSHTVIGAQIAAPLRSAESLVPVIRHHHERWDGTGYPGGLRGHTIPLEARIVAVADSYDALTSNRPYRRARTEAEARAILERGAGSQWDPEVVELFLRAGEAGACA